MRSRMKKIDLVCYFLAVSLLLGSCSTPERPIRFGTAGEGGIYHSFGLLFADILSGEKDLSVEVKETAGSAANLRLLSGGFYSDGREL